MKHINQIWVRLIVVVVIGLLLAGAGTHITYPCPPNGSAGCVSFEKAVDHPGDFLNNKQNSLTNFSEAFVVTSLASFELLSIFSMTQKRKLKPASQLRG